MKTRSKRILGDDYAKDVQLTNFVLLSKRFFVSRERLFTWAAIISSFFLIGWGMYVFLPMGVDWHNTYRPAALQVLALQSPYNVKIFHSPPWSVLPILPIALLSPRLGYAVNFSLSLASTAFVAYRLGAKPISLPLILFSYPIFFMGTYGQVDWLIYLGFIMPPQWGLFFILIKPQASIGVVAFWFIEAIRNGGWRKVFITFSPVTLAFFLSFVLFGNWFQSSFQEIFQGFNASLWPQSIPIGLVLLFNAIRHRSIKPAIAASPFLSPYLAPHGWGVTLLALSPYPFELFAANIGIWILRALTGHFLH